MKITRISGFAAFIAAAAVVLTGCSSDSTDSTSTSSSVAESMTSDAGAGSDSAGAGSSDAPTSDAATSDASSDAGTSDAGSSDAGSSDAGSSDAGSSDAATGGSAAGVSFDAAGFKCATGELRSSGSTAQGKAIDAWIKAYNAKCSAKVNDYGGGGSGKGITDFTANQTDFAGSDSALKDDQKGPAKDRCKGADAIDLPMVTGPIAIAFKLDGVDSLTLTPDVLAGIFNDKITSWDDPAIAKVNPGVTLPATAIQSVHRQEDSGTTENFVKYLKANADWPYEGGKAWEADGGTGSNGSDGVAKAIAGTDGAIGYIEWGFATADNLTVAKIDNGGGAVELTAESAGKAVSAAKVVGTGKDLSLQLDYATKEAGAYPIILVTYEIACSANNADKLDTLKSFLGYAATDGQATLTDVGAAPLPKEIQTKVIAAVKGLS